MGGSAEGPRQRPVPEDGGGPGAQGSQEAVQGGQDLPHPAIGVQGRQKGRHLPVLPEGVAPGNLQGVRVDRLGAVEGPIGLLQVRRQDPGHFSWLNPKVGAFLGDLPFLMRW